MTMEIEFEPPNDPFICECCGGTNWSFTRFVYRDGDARAVYYASFTDRHEDREVSLAIGIGDWGENAENADRAAFAMRMRLGEENFEIMVTDADESPWSDATVLGRMLDREEALAHPLIEEAFLITDYIADDDMPVRRFLETGETPDLSTKTVH